MVMATATAGSTPINTESLTITKVGEKKSYTVREAVGMNGFG